MLLDIVLNHTANETAWLREHPEAGYNLANSPHLRPAFLLDRVLHHATLDIVSGKWEPNGLTTEINCEAHISKLKEVLRDYYLANAKITEMYQIDVESVINEFRNLLRTGSSDVLTVEPKLEVIQDAEYRRNKSTIDLKAAAALFLSANSQVNDVWLEKTCAELRKQLIAKNDEIAATVNGHLLSAVENVASAVRYERLQADGPQIKHVSREHPLVQQYFTFLLDDREIEKEEALIYSDDNVYFMAHNGK